MKCLKHAGRPALARVLMGVLIAIPVLTTYAVHAASSASESAPARAGSATVPTEGPRAGTPAYPPTTSPSSVSESAPATTGPGSTPTRGQGRSAPPQRTDSMGRLPEAPSSVSESAPARTGKASVPTAPRFDTLDYNKDGVIDRSEYDRFFREKKRARSR